MKECEKIVLIVFWADSECGVFLEMMTKIAKGIWSHCHHHKRLLILEY
jgi:hypothetical protein